MSWMKVLNINKNLLYKRIHSKAGTTYIKAKPYLVFLKKDHRMVSTNPKLGIKFLHSP